MRQFSFEGNSLGFREVGHGPAIVYLHGFLEDHSIWNQLVKSFPENKSILIDLSGHGQSSFIPKNTSMKFMAEMVHKLLLILGIENPVVFGHSMGGYVGLELLKLRNCNLTLVHSNFWEDSTEKKKDRDRVIQVLEKGYKHFVREAIPGLFAPENLGKCLEPINSLIAKASTFDPEGIIAATAGMRDRSDNSDLFNSHSIAIIQGLKDPIIPADQMDAKLGLLEKKPLKLVLENVGHMGIWEDPEELIKSMKTIMNQ